MALYAILYSLENLIKKKNGEREYGKTVRSIS